MSSQALRPRASRHWPDPIYNSNNNTQGNNINSEQAALGLLQNIRYSGLTRAPSLRHVSPAGANVV